MRREQSVHIQGTGRTVSRLKVAAATGIMLTALLAPSPPGAADQEDGRPKRPVVTADVRTRYVAFLHQWLGVRLRGGLGRDPRCSGILVMRLGIATDGSLTETAVERSSGDKAVDELVAGILRRSAPLPPPPPELTASGPMRFVAPINLSCRVGAAAAPGRA